MKKALTLIFSSLLAASAVSAQVIGDWGRKTAYSQYGGGVFAGLFKALLGIGVLIIVWLWVIKLWREVFRKKK